MSMTEQTMIEPSEAQQDKAGKYLTFVLAEEEYGLEILRVREIIGMMEITAVPRTPAYVKGVINLRGKVIPVVDLRLKMGMAEAERTEQTCIIVVDIGEVEMGIVVDRVSEVLDIAAEDIEEPPSFGSRVETDFIIGMGKAAERVTILLDISKLLWRSDVAEIVQSEPGASSRQVSQEPCDGQEDQAPSETFEQTPVDRT